MSEGAQGRSDTLLEQGQGSPEELLRTIMVASPDEISMTDLQGNLIFVSGAGHKIFGLERKEDAIGHNLLEFIAPEHRELVKQNFSKRSRNGIEPSEYMALRPNGDRIWIEVNGGMVHDPEGRPEGMLLIVRDITSRKLMDIELKRSEERLALANRKLALLGSMTRHDVLNKLTAMIGYVELASMATPDEEVQKNLDKAKKAAAAIQRQMEVTRAYQQLGAADPEWMDARHAIDAGLIGIEAGQAKMEVDMPEVEVLGDSLFANSIHNLVDNALRHGEKVNIIRITGREERSRFVITIEDDGNGIPADRKESIFDWSYLGRAGHGLNFVQEALRSIGMSIEEVGAEDQGAKFIITVPPGSYRTKR